MGNRSRGVRQRRGRAVVAARLILKAWWRIDDRANAVTTWTGKRAAKAVRRAQLDDDQ